MKSDDKLITILISIMLIGSFIMLMYLDNNKLQLEKQKTEQLKLQLEMKRNN